MFPQNAFEIFLRDINQFICEELVPAETSLQEADLLPLHLQEKIKEKGLFGLTIPQEFGGMDLSVSQEMEVMFAFGKTSPVYQFHFGTNQGIGCQSLLIAGSEKQKKNYLPRMAKGEMISAFALTEEQAGSDASGVTTTALKEKKGWILNGKKRYISNAPSADLFTIVCRTGDSLSAFLVEKSTPGFSVGKIDKKMGHYGAPTAEIFLENCYIPEENLLGKIGEGLSIALQTIERGRLVISGLSVGIAERLIKDCVNYTRSRKQFGKPISDFQLIQALLADSYTEAYAGRCMVKDLATQLDAGIKSSEKISACKYFVTEMVNKVADRAVQIHGGAGYMVGNGIERFYRDVRLFKIYEGTNQIQQLIIAKKLIKNLENILP